jgi:hypothetical protein
MRLHLLKHTILIGFALLLCGAGGRAAERPSRSLHHTHARVGGPAISYAHGRPVRIGGRGGRYADLVGDPDSGLGFYPLPWAYRVGAWRARERRAFEARNDIGFAIASTAIYNNAWPYGYGTHRGVFNPYDGYGTPFFAGWYGPGDPNAEDGPLGRPYR